MYDDNEATERLDEAATQCCVGEGNLKACKVSLLEQFQKQRYREIEKLQRLDRLIDMLTKHPELELVQDFQELLRSKNEGW